MHGSIAQLTKHSGLVMFHPRLMVRREEACDAD